VGVAYPDGIGYALTTALRSSRQSFSPDASYHVGPRPADKMRFVSGAPIFAVEVRSEDDYGPAAEVEMAAKRADYFEAGTLVVWDVDPESHEVAVYQSTAPHHPRVFTEPDAADAEPAVPGWRMNVADIFATAGV
jgi:Uma2 family endonuclease